MSVTTTDYAQYAGELYLFGNTNNPFLSALGAGGRMVNNFDYALSSASTLPAAEIQSITELDSMASPSTFDSFTRDQDVNTCQIIQKYVRTSYKMLSSYNKLIGNASDHGSVDGVNSIDDVHNYNVQLALQTIYKNLNYACWNGTYTRSTSSSGVALTRGLDAAITTYSTSTSGTVAELEKSDIDNHLATVADAGIDTSGYVIWVNSAAKIKLSNLYSLNLQTQPRDRVVGGVNVQTLVTDFGEFGIAYDSMVPTGKIFFINMPYVSNVWCPVPAKGNLYYEEKADVAAGRTGMIYGQWGLDYGAEEVHSVIVTEDAS